MPPRMSDSETGSRMMVNGSNDARSFAHLQQYKDAKMQSSLLLSSTPKTVIFRTLRKCSYIKKINRSVKCTSITSKFLWMPLGDPVQTVIAMENVLVHQNKIKKGFAQTEIRYDAALSLLWHCEPVRGVRPF